MDNSIGTTGRRPSIADGLRLAPHAVYALVQMALVQDEALKRANARIEELQAQTAGELQQQSGWLGSVRDEILGRRDPRGSVPSVRPPPRVTYGRLRRLRRRRKGRPPPFLVSPAAQCRSRP